MSLIHSALKQMDAPTGLVMNAPSASPEKNQSLAVNAAFAFAGLATVLVIAAAMWLGLQPKKLSMMPTQPGAQMPAAERYNPIKPSEVTPPEIVTALVSPLATKDVPTSLALPAALAVQKANQPAKAVARQSEVVVRTASANKQPELVSSNAAKAKPNAAQEPDPTELSVDKRLALFVQATSNNDMPGALEQLKAVQQKAPPGNVSRIRAEGWYALRTGDTAGAKRSYADILDRLPDDEEASINLASLEAREGRREAARQLLANALRSHPDSDSLRDAMKRFKSPAGN